MPRPNRVVQRHMEGPTHINRLQKEMQTQMVKLVEDIDVAEIYGVLILRHKTATASAMNSATRVACGRWCASSSRERRLSLSMSRCRECCCHSIGTNSVAVTQLVNRPTHV